MAWTTQELEWTYDFAKKVYERELTKNEAIDALYTKMPARSKASFGMYIDDLQFMLKGEPIRRSASKDMFELFINSISKDYPDRIKNAFLSVLGYVKYDFSATGNKNIPLCQAMSNLAKHHDIDVVFEIQYENETSSEGLELGNVEAEVEKMNIIETSVKHIKEYIHNKGFLYENGCIENFYLSLKAKPFVILAGISGTGKSKLVELFAGACGATEENGRYKLVPVRPDWSDSSDLFGHMNLTGTFVEGCVIDIIKRALGNPDKPYFLCLDEMNLARVEYYFSDFLSIIETRKWDESKTDIITGTLVSKNLWIRDSEAIKRYGDMDLKLPSNLYVIGTVNMDETTFPFSRKVLDRANTIEFSDVSLVPQKVNQKKPEPFEYTNTLLKAEYLNLPEEDSLSEYVTDICKELGEINEILAISNSQIAYRVRDELVSYRVLNHKYGLMSENEAMDFEIMQKILPRLQGSSNRVKRTLCGLFKHCAGDFGGSNDMDTPELAENMRATYKQLLSTNNCKYRRSAKKLIDMVERFEEDGFTSFWA